MASINARERSKSILLEEDLAGSTVTRKKIHLKVLLHAGQTKSGS